MPKNARGLQAVREQAAEQHERDAIEERVHETDVHEMAREKPPRLARREHPAVLERLGGQEELGAHHRQHDERQAGIDGQTHAKSIALGWQSLWRQSCSARLRFRCGWPKSG